MRVLRFVKCILAVGCLMLAILLSGCEDDEKKNVTENGPYVLYFLGDDNASVVTVSYELRAKTDEGAVYELLHSLKNTYEADDETIYRSLFPEEVTVEQTEITEDHVVVVFLSGFTFIEDRVRETMLRGAIVKTLCRIPGVTGVMLLNSDGSQILANGIEVGVQTGKDYAFSVDEVLDPEMIDFFFIDTSGNGVRRISRAVRLDDFKLREQYLLEILFSGPLENEMHVFNGIPAGVRVNSISTRNRICYLDLNSKFMDKYSNTRGEAVIYSIVNTLTTCSYIDSVVITVDGKPLDSYRGYEVSPILTFSEDIIIQ
ncbi:MAG: GerMN domain-containing protein [Lachnospiraceae bacterium]|nr:GerMN domain-containing protein [Lachnospiraceae bacterium]